MMPKNVSGTKMDVCGYQIPKAIQVPVKGAETAGFTCKSTSFVLIMLVMYIFKQHPALIFERHVFLLRHGGLQLPSLERASDVINDGVLHLRLRLILWYMSMFSFSPRGRTHGPGPHMG